MHTGFTPVILVHACAAIAALALGTVMFLRRKGDASHRRFGRIRAGLMIATALSSFWIRSNGGFSWIHGLSVFTLVLLAFGIRLAIAGNRAGHRKTMQGLFFGALVVSGLFTLMPQRLLGNLRWQTAIPA